MESSYGTCAVSTNLLTTSCILKVHPRGDHDIDHSCVSFKRERIQDNSQVMNRRGKLDEGKPEIGRSRFDLYQLDNFDDLQ